MILVQQIPPENEARLCIHVCGTVVSGLLWKKGQHSIIVFVLGHGTTWGSLTSAATQRVTVNPGSFADEGRYALVELAQSDSGEHWLLRRTRFLLL